MKNIGVDVGAHGSWTQHAVPLRPNVDKSVGPRHAVACSTKPKFGGSIVG